VSILPPRSTISLSMSPRFLGASTTGPRHAHAFPYSSATGGTCAPVTCACQRSCGVEKLWKLRAGSAAQAGVSPPAGWLYVLVSPVGRTAGASRSATAGTSSTAASPAACIRR
jgi:hypothetical protein